MDSGRKYSFVNMLKSSIGGPLEVNNALLDECEIQEDVKIYSQLPDSDDFRGFELSGETDLGAIPN